MSHSTYFLGCFEVYLFLFICLLSIHFCCLALDLLPEEYAQRMMKSSHLRYTECIWFFPRSNVTELLET